MITRNQIFHMNNLFSEYTIKRVNVDAAHTTFQKEHEKIRDLLRKGETTNDPILDWALSGEYPYQDREQSARKIYDCLKEYVGDYFFFLDLQESYAIQSRWKFHAGKIADPVLRYDVVPARLSLAVEEGTLVEKDITSYRYQPASVRSPPGEKSQPFIEGLILSLYDQKDGAFETTHALFSQDDEHYFLMVGQDAALSILLQKRIIPEASKECLDTLIMRAPIVEESDPDSYWAT